MASKRDADILDFLRQTAWAGDDIVWLDQDASTRRYGRINMSNGQTALLMDSPPQGAPACPPDASDDDRIALGWYATARLAASRVDAFVLIAQAISQIGLSTPNIYAYDVENGFCILEDFGPEKEVQKHLTYAPKDEEHVYKTAIEVLAHLHQSLPNTPHTLTERGLSWPLLEFDTLTSSASMDVFYEWYSRYGPGTFPPPAVAWEDACATIIEQTEPLPKVFCFRDFHSQNLLWLADRDGMARIGLLDFQDSIIGWDVWDLDLLLRDARRQISPDLRKTAVRYYCDLTGTSEDMLMARWAIIGTLNALRIIGVYARLIIRDGKPNYAEYMPQQIAHLKAHLAHPKMVRMRGFIAEYFPELLE